ncbi:MAG: septation protein A [Rhizobiales bacterium]|nr:septation protein A [Hyphomicrobiales bacterium]
MTTSKEAGRQRGTETATPAANGLGDGQPHEDVAKQLGKLALELGPLVIFFVANSYKGIFWATGAFMIATAVSLTTSRLWLGRIAVMPLVTGVFVMVFGGLTLVLNDALFIKLKPTIVNLLFASILLGCLLIDKLIWKLLFGDVFRLTDTGWRKLQFRWGIFFLVLAGLNEIVWRGLYGEPFSHLPLVGHRFVGLTEAELTDIWVKFKVFGIMPLTLIFAMTTLPVLQAHELKGESTAGKGESA